MGWKKYMTFRLAIAVIVLFVAGIVLTVNGIKDSNTLSKDIPDFNEMHEYDFEEGMFVEGYVPLCYGNFAYEYEEDDEDNSVVEYYLIPLLEDSDTDYKYIVISVTNEEQMELMNTIIDQTYDFMDDPNLEYDDIDWADFYFVGQVRELDSEIEGYLYEWLDDGEWLETGSRDEFDEMVVSLDVRYREPSSVGSSLSAGIAMMVIPLLIIAVIVVVRVVKKNNSGMYAGETHYNYNGQNMNNGFGQQNANQFTSYSGINPTANNGYNQNNFNQQQGNQGNQYVSANDGLNSFNKPQNFAGNTQQNFNSSNNSFNNTNSANPFNSGNQQFNSSNKGFNNTNSANPFNSGNQQFNSNNNGFSNANQQNPFNSGSQQFHTQGNNTKSMDELDTSKIDHTKL